MLAQFQKKSPAVWEPRGIHSEHVLFISYEIPTLQKCFLCMEQAEIMPDIMIKEIRMAIPAFTCEYCH
jgi:hypothetical protein